MTVETLRFLDDGYQGQFIYVGYGTTETSRISDMLYLFRSISLKGKMIATFLRMFKAVGMLTNKKTIMNDCVGAIGKNVRIKIVEDGMEQSEGKIGEIVASTNTMIKSAESEFYHTGDMGYVKSNKLFIVGRKTDIINRSGEKIIPVEVEAAISKLDGVKRVVVFGIPSVTHGESICAAIECEGGTALFDRNALEREMPKYMIPQYLHFMEEFPINASGKIDRLSLKSLMADI